MQRIFIKNIALILGLNLLVKPLYILAIEAKVQTTVGTADYGIYFGLFNFCLLFQFFLDLGIQNYTSRNISAAREKFAAAFGQLVLIKLLLAVLFLTMVFVGLYFIGHPLYTWHHAALIILQLVLVSFLVFIRANISALGFYTWDSLISSLDKLLLVLGLGYVLWFSEYVEVFTITWFIVAQIISLVISLAVALIVLKSKGTFQKINLSLVQIKNLLKQSFPYALVLLLMTLYTRMDAVMLNALLDDKGYQAGVYAAGYRIMDAFNMLGYLFAGLLLPMFASIKLSEERAVLFETAFKLLFTLVIIATVASYWYAQEIMDLVYTADSTSEYGRVFSILMLCFSTIALAYIYGSMITATGKLRKLNILYGLGILVNWGLNLWLIPRFMAVGAAWATLATQSVVFIGLIYISKVDLGLSISKQIFLRVIIFIAMAIAAYVLLSTYSGLVWYITALIGIFFCLGVSFLLGFLRLDIMDTLKQKV